MEDKIKDYIRDMAVNDALEIIKKLTIEIDKYYIKRSEHEKIVKALEEEIKENG